MHAPRLLGTRHWGLVARAGCQAPSLIAGQLLGDRVLGGCRVLVAGHQLLGSRRDGLPGTGCRGLVAGWLPGPVAEHQLLGAGC